jgi:pre-mRNA-splicing factor ATP-dependent RNA helicase DHX16
MCVYAAKECSSTGDLVGKLVEFGFTSSAETRSFAADIYAKVPRKASGISVRSDCSSFVARSS